MSDQLLGSTGSIPRLEKARSWLSRCLSEHSDTCAASQDESILPKRVLDLRPSEGLIPLDGHVVLVEDLGISAPYVCLSHCWGSTDRHPLETNTRNLYHHKLRISLEHLPKTFRDATEVARRFEVRYLWIDSLCIIQDDCEDWRTQSSRMSEVYQGAIFTIAATAAVDSSFGLYTEIQPVHEGMELSALTNQGDCQGTYIRAPLHHAKDPTHRPLTSRGWVFQERMLSPRVLHFDRQELIWECTRETMRECKYGTDVTSRWVKMRRTFQLSHLRTLEKGTVHRRWHKAVEQYSLLLLSREHDILPAISGIAKRLQLVTGSAYLAGLWRDNLILDLCWSTGPDKSNRTRRATQYRAPTFSWASILTSEVGVRFYSEDFLWLFFENDEWCHEMAKVTDAWCEVASTDTTGQVSNGYIDLQGKLFQGRLIKASEGSETWDIAHVSSGPTPVSRHYHRLDSDYDFDVQGRDHVAVGETLYTFPLLHITAVTRNWGMAIASLSLVLRRCKGQSDLEDNLTIVKTPAPTYERVGLYREVTSNPESAYAEGSVQHKVLVRIV